MFSFNIQDEKKKDKAIKKTIKKLLNNVNETAQPIDFGTHQVKYFRTYILSLQRIKGDSGKRLSIASY